jgi:hypothetical protein
MLGVCVNFPRHLTELLQALQGLPASDLGGLRGPNACRCARGKRHRCAHRHIRGLGRVRVADAANGRAVGPRARLANGCPRARARRLRRAVAAVPARRRRCGRRLPHDLPHHERTHPPFYTLRRKVDRRRLAGGRSTGACKYGRVPIGPAVWVRRSHPAADGRCASRTSCLCQRVG